MVHAFAIGHKNNAFPGGWRNKVSIYSTGW